MNNCKDCAHAVQEYTLVCYGGPPQIINSFYPISTEPDRRVDGVLLSGNSRMDEWHEARFPTVEPEWSCGQYKEPQPVKP